MPTALKRRNVSSGFPQERGQPSPENLGGACEAEGKGGKMWGTSSENGNGPWAAH